MHSLLWAYYDGPKEGKAKCKICWKEVAVTGGTTTGLKKHLKLHPKSLEEFTAKQEEKDKNKELTTAAAKRTAENQVEEKPLKQMKLDFGAQENARAKQSAFDEAVVNFVSQIDDYH